MKNDTKCYTIIEWENTRSALVTSLIEALRKNEIIKIIDLHDAIERYE